MRPLLDHAITVEEISRLIGVKTNLDAILFLLRVLVVNHAFLRELLQ
jgi:hypothetical protein